MTLWASRIRGLFNHSAGVVADDIDWEVAGIVEELGDQPRRPVVFLKAGEHKVIDLSTWGDPTLYGKYLRATRGFYKDRRKQ